MLHFGFSYIGFLYLLLLFIPNIVWSKNQPKDYEKYVVNENKILLILERAGEIFVCCFVLIFSDFNIQGISLWSLWILLSFLLMILYECYWIRYFKSEKTMADFYSAFCGIPLAGATLPVLAFFFLGIYGGNFPLLVSVVILGIGHIGIHRSHRKEVVPLKPKLRKVSFVVGVVFKWIGIIAAAAMIMLVLVVTGVKNVTYLTGIVRTNGGVDEGIYVSLDGQEQYLLIRGADVHNPVIIWLHGGPASPDTFITYQFTNYLVDDYTVICWDQRGCGRTYFRNRKKDPDNETVTFTQAQADLDELVDYACERFETEQVIMIGHSYGTMLGSQYALEHPDKVAAYVGIGQVVTIESDIYSYEDALTRAQSKGDDTTLMTEAYETNTILTGLCSPYMGVDDFRWFMKQLGSMEDYISLNQSLFDYIQTTDVRDYGLEYQVPACFISGSEDWTTPVKYAEDYYQMITAPQKKFYLIEGCGHAPQNDFPEKFSAVLKIALGSFVEYEIEEREEEMLSEREDRQEEDGLSESETGQEEIEDYAALEEKLLELAPQIMAGVDVDIEQADMPYHIEESFFYDMTGDGQQELFIYIESTESGWWSDPNGGAIYVISQDDNGNCFVLSKNKDFRGGYTELLAADGTELFAKGYRSASSWKGGRRIHLGYREGEIVVDSIERYGFHWDLPVINKVYNYQKGLFQVYAGRNPDEGKTEGYGHYIPIAESIKIDEESFDPRLLPFTDYDFELNLYPEVYSDWSPFSENWWQDGGRYPEEGDKNASGIADWIEDAADDKPDEMLANAVEQSGLTLEKTAYPWTEETKANVMELLRCPVADYYYISEEYAAAYMRGEVCFYEKTISEYDGSKWWRKIDISY